MTDVWRAVMEAGVDVVPVDARHVELRHGSHTDRVRLHTSPRAVNPSDVAELAGRYREPGLLVVPAATAAVRRAVDRVGWSLLITGPRGVRGILRLGGYAVAIGAEDGVGHGRPARGRSGPVPWGSLTVVRRLLQQPAATQTALAALAGVSQPRVSQTLAALAGQHLVTHRDNGWVVRDFDGLLRWWLERYPGPGGISTYWYGLDPLHDQARAVIRLLGNITTTRSRRMEPAAVVSGDVAADLLAPWRTPTRAVVYAHAGADLTEAGLTPAGGEEATVELILPQDLGVWSAGEPSLPAARVSGGRETARRDEPSMPLADPVQVLWDVRRAPGPDSGEAAERLWALLRERHRLVHSRAAS